MAPLNQNTGQNIQDLIMNNAAGKINFFVPQQDPTYNLIDANNNNQKAMI